MSKLDVEQQLRQLEEQKKAAGMNAPSQPARVAFVSQENYEVVAQPAIMVAGCVLLACAAVFFMTTTNRKLRARLADGLKSTHAVLFSTPVSVPVYGGFMVAWLVGITVNTVFRLMEKAALTADKDGHHSAPVDITNVSFLALPLGLFCSEYFGVVGLWLYPLGRTAYTMEIGVVAALLVFFPSFYQSLVLDNEAPERLPLWTSHAVFLTSLFALYAVGFPWLRREYREALKELRSHTNQALYRERPELRDLRLRRGANNKRK